jgi:hypothetical protein
MNVTADLSQSLEQPRLMARYHLDLQDGEIIHIDTSGEESESLAHAREAAIVRAREYMWSAFKAGQSFDVHRQFLIREGTEIVDTVPFSVAMHAR